MQKEQFKCEKLMARCFPVDESDISHSLNEIFTDQFCDPLNCNYAKPKDSNEFLEKHSRSWTVDSTLWTILLFFSSSRYDGILPSSATLQKGIIIK